jgi:hypothetical protein
MGLGSYSIATASGLIVATGAVNALIWTCRWTSAVKRALIERLRVNAVVTGTITTSVPYDLAAFFVTGYSVAPTTSIATATLTGRNGARKTAGVDPSLMGGIFTLTTIAAGITGHTFVADTQPLGRVAGATGTVIGNQFFGGQPVTLIDSEEDMAPVILGEEEGLALVAPLAGPASGTFRVAVTVDWKEVGS